MDRPSTSRVEPAIGVDDVAELRTLLRRGDAAPRHLGVALLRGWSASQLDAVGARAVLEAAAGSYPRVAGIEEHPAEMLAQLLWDCPQLVAVDDVLRVYVVAGDRARRAFLHLLSIRGGTEGLAGVEQLLGRAVGDELIPAPTYPILDPLLVNPDHDRVRRVLTGVLGRPGWAWHASELLGRLEAAAPSVGDARSDVVSAAVAVVAELVPRCDELAGREASGADRASSDRRTIATLLRLIDVLDQPSDALALDGAERVLWQMLACADPQVAALGAVRLLQRGRIVAPERLELIARDALACVDLHDGLLGVDGPIGSAVELDTVRVHEGRLVRWLSEVTELGRRPDEIEFVALAADPSPPSSCTADGPDALHVFRFRMHSPHWSSARGWMIGTSGDVTSTCYAAEDECSIEDHVCAVRAATDEWPDRRSDGAG